MRRLLFVLISLLFLFSMKARSREIVPPLKDTLIHHDSLRDTIFMYRDYTAVAPPEETFRRKKLITCIMAFPLPFGFAGLHRIYLGTEPWVPIVYLCTGGGGIGLLPLIDFLYIVTANEEEFKKYENNPKVFMFVE